MRRSRKGGWRCVSDGKGVRFKDVGFGEDVKEYVLSGELVCVIVWNVNLEISGFSGCVNLGNKLKWINYSECFVYWYESGIFDVVM